MFTEKAVQSMIRRRWLIFAVLALAYFFVYFHRVTTTVMGGYFESDFHVGASSIALLSSLYFYAYAVMQLPSGILTDRWGPRRTIISIVLLAPVGILLTATAQDFNMVLLGRLLIGLGLAAVYVPVMRIFATWFQKDRFASLSGSLLAIGNFAGIVAAGPLALMTETFGWREVYLFIGLLTLAVAFLSYAIVRDRPEDLHLPSANEVHHYLADGELVEDPYDLDDVIESIPVKRALRMVFGGGKRFWPLAIWFFLIYGSVITYQGLWAAPFFRETLGWDVETAALTLSFIGIGIIVGAPVSGYLSDRILKSRKQVLMLGTAMYTLVWVSIWWLSGILTEPEQYMVLHFLFGFFGGFYVVSFAQIKELFPVAIVGTCTASLNIFPFAGAAIMQQLSAVFIGDHSVAAYQAVWFFVLFCLLISMVSLSFSMEKKTN